MLHSLKRFFSRVTDNTPEASDQQIEHDIRVATCALFLEMARIDETFTDAEMQVILSTLEKKYGLAQEHADALLAEADQELQQSVDLWQFASLINENYSIEEKIEIVETLWRIVFVDQKMDKYENYLMHKVSNLLRLSHSQLIDAKMKVMRST